jgi:hypothetical protein
MILLPLVGAIDLSLAVLVLIKPIRIAVLWMAFWGFWTELLRPLAGEPIWDFIERWANWEAPLALLLFVLTARNYCRLPFYYTVLSCPSQTILSSYQWVWRIILFGK